MKEEQLQAIANIIQVSYTGFGIRTGFGDKPVFNYHYSVPGSDLSGTYSKGIGHAVKIVNGSSKDLKKRLPGSRPLDGMDKKIAGESGFKRVPLTIAEYQGIEYYPPITTGLEILSSLVSDALCVDDSTFEDFCVSLGYDTESRKALDTYLTCQRTLEGLRKLDIYSIGEAFEILEEMEAL